MDKPRIVIMGKDYSYIAPLQTKFIYEFMDDVELEIITEQEYVDSFFQELQKISVLVIDEAFYTEDVSKHEIDHLFLLSENEDDMLKDKVAGINVLYKYTNTKEIFLEIAGKSKLKVPTHNNTSNPQLIVIASATGGVGKTTVALGLAAALSDMYKKVLYIEASRLQTFQFFMDNTEPIQSSLAYKKLTKLGRGNYLDVKEVLRKQKFTYLPPMKAPIMSFGIDYNVFGTIAKAAKESGEYDFVILDTDAVFDEAKAKMMNVADKVLIITEPTDKSMFSTNVLVQSINNSSSEKYYYICNKYKETENQKTDTQNKSIYKIDDYVDFFDNYSNMRCEKFGQQESIRKIAFLLL